MVFSQPLALMTVSMIVPEISNGNRTRVSAPVALITPPSPKVIFHKRLTIAAVESVDKSCNRRIDSAAQGKISVLKSALMPEVRSRTCRENVSAQAVPGSAIKLTLYSLKAGKVYSGLASVEDKLVRGASKSHK